MKYNILLIVCFGILLSCGEKSDKKRPEVAPQEIAAVDSALRITFGSCSDEDKPQPLWDDIIAENSDCWIWLGDNIYGDTNDRTVLQGKYELQNANADYRRLKQEVKILGTWDDHDYGLNDSGKNFPGRDMSQKLFLDFIGVDKNDGRRERQGVYHSEYLTKGDLKVNVILLDTRFFRDDMERVDGVYLPNMDGTMLGDQQWNWLDSVLEVSTAQLHLIASSIQLLSSEHRFEKWENFPSEKQRLFKLLEEHNVDNPIFISGDRHIGELSGISLDSGMNVYDITSSSLTHGWSNRNPESNKYRIGEIVYDENYGLLTIDQDLEIKAFLKGENRKEYLSYSIPDDTSSSQ